MSIYTNSFIQVIQSISLPNKYTKWYCQIVARAQHRATAKKAAETICNCYIERHHIVPDSFYVDSTRPGATGWLAGKPNQSANYAFVTNQEHFLCHWLLSKMGTTQVYHSKMINALNNMRRRGKGQERYDTPITSRVYANIKGELAERNSDLAKGTASAKSPITGEKLGRISVTDTRWVTGEIVGVTSKNANPTALNTARAKCAKTGKSIGCVSLNDPRWVAGEIVGVCSGNKYETTQKTGVAKFRATGLSVGYRVPLTDPRWATGEIVGFNRKI